MVQDNLGIVGFSESRENLERLKRVYQEEYRKISEEQRNNNKKYIKNKWRVRIGEFLVTELGLVHTPMSVNVVGSIATGVTSKTTQLVMKIKNRIDNKKYKKQQDKLTADFINLQGIFQQYSVQNNSQMEPIQEFDIEEKGFQI